MFVIFLSFSRMCSTLFLIYIVSWRRSLTNQKDVLSLRLPRLRHQAHKELYAYKQVSTPGTHTHTAVQKLENHTQPIVKQKWSVRVYFTLNYEGPLWSQLSWCTSLLADSSGSCSYFEGSASQWIQPIPKYLQVFGEHKCTPKNYELHLIRRETKNQVHCQLVLSVSAKYSLQSQ